MFPPDESTKAADPLAPSQFTAYSTNPLKALLIQPKPKSKLRESIEPVEGEQAAYTPTALPNQRKDIVEESQQSEMSSQEATSRLPYKGGVDGNA